MFVPGNGDSAATWQTTIWRFESNGWPRSKLFAMNPPYPLARDDDAVAQPGRSGTADQRALLKATVHAAVAESGTGKVVLMGNSRGGYAIRDYLQTDPEGPRLVSKAILAGTPNHGVWSIPGYKEGSEFSGTGPFLSRLNAPKNAAGDEVTGPVQWLTIRSDRNDKYAQPDGAWIGKKGTPTGVSYDAPALKGATNVVIPRIDHRETAYSEAAFQASWRFITGEPPRVEGIRPEPRIELSGTITGLGLHPTDPTSGGYTDNLPLPGATLEVYAVRGGDDDAAGERMGSAVYRKVVAADGRWGPFEGQPDQRYEFVIAAPGYATTHIYRSPLPRSSDIMDMQPLRLSKEDRSAKEVVLLTRPRGYLDLGRDIMRLDGKLPPGLPPMGAGIPSARLRLHETRLRSIVADFNGERIIGRTWPAASGEVTVLEITR